MRGNAQLMSQW